MTIPLHSNIILLKLHSLSELKRGICCVSEALSICLLFVCEKWTYSRRGHLYLPTASLLCHYQPIFTCIHPSSSLSICVRLCAVCLSELGLFVSPHVQGWGYFNKISVPHIASCIIHVHWYSAPQNRPLSSDNSRNTRRKKIHFSIQSFSECICMVNHSHVGSWSINRAHMSLHLDLD